MEWLLGTKYIIWAFHSKCSPKIYLWKNWEQLFPLIDELVAITDTETFIRSFQSYTFENKWLGFGRMKWSLDNNKKWTTKYRIDKEDDKELAFFSTEVWSPDWNECQRRDKGPYLYLKVYSGKNSIDSGEGCIIAMPRKLVRANKQRIEGLIEKIADQITDSTVSVDERRWTPSNGYVNTINDMNPHELKKLVEKSV